MRTDAEAPHNACPDVGGRGRRALTEFHRERVHICRFWRVRQKPQIHSAGERSESGARLSLKANQRVPHGLRCTHSNRPLKWYRNLLLFVFSDKAC